MAIKITGPIGQGGAGGAVTSVNGATGAVNLYADNATLNLAGDGIVVNGAGATSTLDVDSGTTANKIVKLDGSARLPAVDGSQLTNLPSAPVTSVNGATGAVNIYADDTTLNIDGTGLVLSGTGATSTLNADVGTGANQLVQLDGSSRLPAVDGSQLTNLPSAPVTSVNGATGAVNLYADDATLNLAGDGIVVSGTGATSTLDVDSGTTANKIVKLDGSARLPAVDGSQLTNLPSAPVTSVNGATGAVNIYADDSTLNIDGTGLVLSGTGATSTLNADVGTGANQLVQLDASSRLPAVDGSQLTNLPSAPVTSVNGATGAVNIYADDTTLNIDGTGLVLSGTGATSTLNADVGTGANQLVQLDASSRLPAVDGSQLTNLPSAPVTSVNGATGAVNLYADDATLNLAGDGIVVSGTGATSTLDVDSGTTANKIVKLDGSARLPAVDGSQLTNLPSAPVTSVNGQTGAVTGLLEASNNLSDVANAATARSNLGAIAEVLDDLSPQLGGDLDVQARIIETSTANGSIGLEPDGTGSVVARGTGVGNTPGTLTLNCEQNSHGVALQSPPHSAAASYTLKLPTGVGTSGQALTTDGNTPAQLSWTTVGGGGSRPTVTTDSSGTNSTISDPSATTLEDIYLVSNGASAVTITLPTVTGNSGYQVNIKRLGTATVTISPASGTIDGAGSTALTVQYMSLTLACDGTNWHII